jgi:hypothetical protein
MTFGNAISAVSSGHDWIIAAYLLFPLAAGLVFGAVFTCLVRWLDWPTDLISIAPISAMFGVLSYVVAMAIYISPTVTGNFTFSIVSSSVVIVLFMTWPIAFVMGPVFLIYVAYLRKGRKVLKDSTVLYISGLCLISEALFLKFFLSA